MNHSHNQKDSDDKFLKTEAFLESVIALMPGHVYWKDLNGNYLGCNDAQAKALGLVSRNDIINRIPYEKLPKSKANKLRQIDEMVLREKKTITEEEPGIRENGSLGIFLTKKTPLFDINGNVVGLLGISFDITAEKETVQLKQQAERQNLLLENLKKQVALSEHLAAVVAHEVRTPLVSIQAGTTCIKDCIKSGDLKEITEICDEIRTQLHKVGNFIDTFLQNVKHEMPKNIDKHGIKNTIAIAIREYPFLDEQQRSLVKIDKTINNFIYLGEERLIIHVLFNLLKNALYFIAKAEKGHVEIFTSTDENNNFLHFKDFACGIAKEDLDLIFDRFFTKTNVGTGIGLSYCKMTMTAHNGDIICHSEPGKFAEFILRFPKIVP